MPKIFKINTTNIVPDMVLKNYKELCKILGINYPNDSKAKKKQYKYIKECLDIERLKGTNKYIIHAIKKESTVTKDGRSNGNHCTYNKYTPDILMDYICYHAEGETIDGYKTVKLSNNEIMQIVGFCNSRYGHQYYTKELISQNKVTRLDIQQFYLRHGAKCKGIISSTLNQLKQRMPELGYKEVYEIEDKNGNIRISSDEEIDIIKRTEDKIMEELNVNSKFMLFIKNKQDEFYGELLPNTLQDNYDWKTKKKYYLIRFPDAKASNDWRFKMDDDQKEHLKAGANKLIKDYLDNNTHKIYSKAVEDGNVIQDEGDDDYNGDLSQTQAYSPTKKRLYKIRPDYLEKQLFLSEELVNI